MKLKQKWKKLCAGFLIGIMAAGIPAAVVLNTQAEELTLTKTATADPYTLEHWAYSFGDSADTELPDSSANVGRIWTDKSVFTGSISRPGSVTIEKTEGADFLVGLSALSSASSELISTSVPLDIVLVLDASGSMEDTLYSYREAYGVGTNGTYYVNVNGSWETVNYSRGGSGQTAGWRYGSRNNYTYVTPMTSAEDTDSGHVQFYSRTTGSRMAALQSAVGSFLDSTAEQNQGISESARQHRVALVKFAGDASDNIGNDLYYDRQYNSYYNCSQIVSAFTSDFAALKSTVNEIEPGGATRADYGMQYAAEALKSARENAKKIVIFFTDGQPTSSSTFSGTVANSAITSSRTLKAGGITVYTIGIFDDADPSNTTSNFNRYMHAVSSNYPNASAYNNLGTRAENSNYYKAASSSDELDSIFSEIASELSAPTPPTQVDSADPMSDGYITFTDTLGDYMEVKDVNSIYLETLFEEKQTSTAGNRTTYTFSGTIDSPVYGRGDLSNIEISVQKSSDEKTGDTVTVRIPAGLLPLRYYNISNNEAAGALNMEITNANPVRVFYSVGLKDSTEKKLLGGNITDDTLKQYLADHTVNGKVQFYSNTFTKGSENGNTTAEFSPATTNPFYYYTEDTPLYSDEACTQRVMSGTQLAETYYYKNFYYVNNDDGTTERTWAPIAVSGADVASLQGDNLKVDEAGYAYLEAGSVKVSRMRSFTEVKTAGHVIQGDNPVAASEANPTGTASNVITPSWNNTSVQATIYLGNNGLLEVDGIPGNLAISKQVTADNGLTAPEKTFAFKVVLSTSGEYDYDVTETGNTTVLRSGTVSNGDTITLGKDETAVIKGLPAGTVYTVTEEAQDGFTASVNGTEGAAATGTIKAGEQAAVDYVNNYSAAPITTTIDNFFSVKKIFNMWKEDSAFHFLMSSSTATDPLPGGATGAATLTIDNTANTIIGDGEKTGAYDMITFTHPGTYSYSVWEVTPDTADRAPGVDYSNVAYAVVFEVTDNGQGALAIDPDNGVAVYKLTDDAGNLLSDEEIAEAGSVTDRVMSFTNKYDAESTIADIFATKAYKDHSGNRDLQDNMFQFRLTAVTAGAPMPRNAVTDSETGEVYSQEGNVNDSIVFAIDYGTDHIHESYTYKLTEVIPSEAEEKDGVYTRSGVTYDAREYYVVVEVGSDDSSGTAVTTAAVTYYKDSVAEENRLTGERSAVFNNAYTPEPVTLTGDTALHGIKTLTGRDITAEDSFTFTLTAADANDVSGYSVAADGDGALADTDGTFRFGDITFTKPGTYVFYIGEDVPASNPQNGITYDTHTCTATVTVTDTDGALSVETVYHNGAGAADNSQAAFTNSYEAERVTLDPDNFIQVEKVLVGRDWQAGDRFYFELSADEGTPVPANPNINIVSAEAVTDPDGTVHYRNHFGDITYTAAGDYTYRITETKGTLPGMTYDEHTAQVVVKIRDDSQGSLYVADVVYDENTEAAVFTNTYGAAEVTLTGSTAIRGTKTVVGRSLTADDDFTFTLEPADDKTRRDVNEQLVILPSDPTAKADASQGGAFTFGDVIFREAGTYTFRITENIPEESAREEGMTYDGHECLVTVVVSDRNGASGQLTASVTYSDGAAALFRNVLAANEKSVDAGDGQLVSGGQRLTYTIDWVNNAADDTGVPVAAEVTITDTIPAGTTYVDGSAGQDAVYDEDSRTLTWTVNASAAATGSVSFAVTVDTQSVSMDPITNTATVKIGDNEYRTNIVTNPVTRKTVSNDDTEKTGTEVGDILNYTITWANPEETVSTVTITDKLPDTLDYVADSADNGGVYDVAAHTIIWTLEDKQSGESGSVTFKARVNENAMGQNVENDAEVQVGDQEISTNTTGTPVSGGSGLVITKSIETIEGQNTTADAEKEFIFTVTLKDAKGQDLAGSYAYTIDGEAAGTVSNGETISLRDAQKAEISGLPIGAGYSITEAEEDGYTAEAQTITGTVSADGSTAAFVNTYQVAPVSDAVVEAVKTMTRFGEPADLGDRIFGFELSGNTLDTPRIASNDAEGRIRFENIELDAVGTWTFTLKEIDGGLGGITYDDSVYTVTLRTEDQKDGTLKVVSTVYAFNGIALEDGELPEFINDYTADFAEGSDSFRLEGSKELTGREMKSGEFTFEVTDEDGTAVVSGSNDENGKIVFPEIGFGLTNEEYQELKAQAELPETAEEPKIDEAEATDAESGEMETPETDATESDETADQEAEAPEAGEAEDEKTEEKVGENQAEAVGEDQAEAADQTEAGSESEESEAAAAGSEAADEAQENETPAADPAESDDTSVSTEAEDAAVPEESQAEAAEEAVRPKVSGFALMSSVKPAAVAVPADAEVLEPSEDEAAKKELSAEAKKKMAALLGDHWYTVREVGTDGNGITYDKTVFKVKVTVSDDGNGNLNVSDPVYYAEDGTTEVSGMTFRNSYSAAEAEITIQAGKLLTGRELKENEFSFNLLENGQVIAGASNDAEGAIRFAMNYKEAGEHTYTISEVKGGDSDITYSDAVYTVTVNVTDDGLGQLKTEISYPAGGVVFVNKYTDPTPTEPTPEEPEPTDPKPQEPEKPHKAHDPGDSDDSTPATTAAPQSTASPKTGDSTPIALYVGLLIVSAGALIAVWRTRRKRGRH